MKKGFNSKALATRWGCSIDQVRNLIDSGELPAVNIGLGKQRARWVVPEESVVAFEQRRSNQQPGAAPRRKPETLRRSRPANIKRFYRDAT
ncbi:MAG: helix-turn-helix domain-containing protein [Phycisphaera sp. RhM]|nr:helix-turn-helix domain-containing protein [Phycisphaera sp. RhM]